LLAAFANLNPPSLLDGTLTTQPLAACRQQLAQQFDKEFGGFGGAPKFPQSGSIDRLLQHWYDTATTPEPDLHALYMATLTLTRMAEGGVYDQIGGGFARYSVGADWMIPHFEKMLYDNALLLSSYADAHLATSEPLFGRIASETADWLIRDLQSPAGGFYSSFDADSEGHEGSFYAWDRQIVRELLTAEEFAVISRYYGLDLAANFEQRWHFFICRSIASIAEELSIANDEVDKRLQSARSRLLEARNTRPWPKRDEKVLASWNALVIRGFARASRALRREDLAVAADDTLQFLRSHLLRDGRLLATCKDGKSQLNAYLDDYAFLADAMLELLQIRWQDQDAALLRQLCDVLLAHFEDREHGGFFFTSDDHEALIHRSKPLADETAPSGNGIAARALLRAGYLFGESRYLDAAERTLRASWRALEKYPHAHVSLIDALSEHLFPPEIVILRGEHAEISRWQRELEILYAPHRLIFAIPSAAAALVPAIASKPASGLAVGYVCRGSTCSLPVDSLTELVRMTKLRLADH